MFTKRISAVFALLLLPLQFVFSQDKAAIDAFNEGKALVTKGLNTSDPQPILQGRAIFERFLEKEDVKNWAHYYVGYAGYRLSLVYIQKNDRQNAIKYGEDAIKHLEAATERDRKFAEAWALLSSCYGQQIRFDQTLAPSLGMQSSIAIATAKEEAPENPRVNLIGAIGTFFTPPQYGGDKEAGLEEFKDAVELFKSWRSDDPLAPNWGHDEAYAWIGFANIDLGQKKRARRALERALKINPNNNWVKHVLLPQTGA